jgi:RimJ/RimL family protein N-acetyltransferase
LKLHRVVAAAAEGNAPSLRVIDKLGFTFEAVQRDAYLIGNTWHNLRSYAMIQSDYKSRRQSLYDKILNGKRPKVRL